MVESKIFRDRIWLLVPPTPITPFLIKADQTIKRRNDIPVSFSVSLCLSLSLSLSLCVHVRVCVCVLCMIIRRSRDDLAEWLLLLPFQGLNSAHQDYAANTYTL